MQKILFALLIGLFASSALAAPSIVYHGRLLNSANTPVTGSVNFKIQVLSPGAEECVLWEETQTQTLTAGVFALSLNGSASTRIDAGAHSFIEAFSNRKTFNVGAPSCAPTYSSYTPGATHARMLKVSFNDGSFMGWEDAPDQAINYAPKALDSYSVGGYPATSVMRFAESSGALVNAAAFDQDDYDELVNLLEGDSALYLATSATEGTTLPVLTGNPVTLAPGKIWYEGGEIKYYDAVSSTVKTIGSGSVSSSGNSATAGMTIGTTTNYDLKFITNNSTRMTIDTSGKIGIGTTAPGYMLDVNGSAHFTDIKLGSNNLTIKQDTTNANQIQFSNHIMTPAGVLAGFGTNAVSSDQVLIKGSTTDSTKNGLNVINSGSSTLLVARNDGNTGFGVSSPQRQVHIQGSGTLGSVRIDRTGNAPTIQMHQFPDATYGTPYQGWQFGMDGNWNFIIGDYGTALGGGPVSTPFTVAKTTGRIGIGTTAPSTTLSFDGEAARTIAMERITGGNNGSDLTISSGGATSGSTDKKAGDLYLTTGTSTGNGIASIYLQTSASSGTGTTDRALTTRMQIDGLGLIGVGGNGVNSNGRFYSWYGRVNPINGTSTASIYGNGDVSQSGGNTSGESYGIHGRQYTTVTGAAAQTSGYNAGVLGQGLITQATSIGTVNHLIGVRADYGISSAATSGILTNGYGVYVKPVHGAGTFTNSYGVYVETPTGAGTATNEYGFYQASSTGKSYFAGKVGIGTTSPTAALTVNGPIVSLQNSPSITGATPTFASTLTLANSSAFSLNPSTAVANDTLALTLSGTSSNGASYLISLKDAVVLNVTFTAATCGSIKYKPGPTAANTITTAGTGGTLITVTTIHNGVNHDCYVSWATGYQ